MASAFQPKAAFSPRTTSTRLQEHKLEGRTIEEPVKPLNNFILVKVAESLDQTDGGIILTAKAKQKKTEGIVVSCGPGRTHQESGLLLDIPVSEGDSVVYGKFDGTELDYDGEKHTLIRDDDVMVKFQGETLSLDNVEVTNDNVLVYVEENEQATSGGLLIAQSSTNQKRPTTGEVVKVGPGRRTMNGDSTPMEVVVGDMVKFRDFAGNEVKIDGKEYSVVRMPDILAKF
jgi:chaperonin GroES